MPIYRDDKLGSCTNNDSDTTSILQKGTNLSHDISDDIYLVLDLSEVGGFIDLDRVYYT